jgi:hypothetical protein
MRSIRAICRVLGVVAAAGMAWSCESSAAPSDPPPAANAAPVIGPVSLSESGFRTARLTGNATDSDGQITAGTVDWGDGTTTAISSGFANISLTHRYNRAQAYSVTLRVTDDDGVAAQLTRSVTIKVPPEACLGILVIEVCAESSADFRNLQIAAKAGDIVLAGITVSDGNPSVVLPLALGFGRLTVSHNFTSGRLTITGEVCPVPFLVCQTIASQAIQF